jgi:hypothetical protein
MSLGPKSLFEKLEIPGLLLLVNIIAPGSGSGSTFQIRIWIQTKESQINLEPDPDPKHWRFHKVLI